LSCSCYCCFHVLRHLHSFPTRRSSDLANPAQAKSLAQDLVVKEHVQYLAGFYFTPDAMAVTPLLEQANVPMVIMNAATSAIVTRSEEHTSELQSPDHLVCRLLLEKKHD